MDSLKPSFAPDTKDQTVEANGYTWKGQPGGDWTLQSKTGSGGGVNTQAYDDLINNTRSQISGYATDLNAKENQSLDSYFNYIKNQPSPVDFYSGQLEQAGIPETRNVAKSVRSQIYNLEETLRKVEPDVSANTRNSLVTESQRRGLVQSKQQPIIEDLNWATQNLGRLSEAIANGEQTALTLTSLYQQSSQQFIDFFKTSLEVAQNQGSRGLQAFIADSNNYLNVSLAKIARGEAVADREEQQAFELFTMQRQAEQRMKELEFSANQPDTQVIDLGGRKALIDTRTGQEISSYNDVLSPSSGINFDDIMKYFSENTPGQTSNQNTGQSDFTPTGVNTDYYKFLLGDSPISQPSASLKR